MTPPPSTSSAVQWSAKAIVFLVAMVLAVRHELTPEVAGVISAALFALGVTNAATLVAATKGNLGTMIHQVIAALPAGVIVSIPPPPMPPPPMAPAAVGAAAVGAVVVALALGAAAALQCTACAPAMTLEDHARTGTELAEGRACIEDHRGDVPATDRCRAAVKARWDARWIEELDGGRE